MTPPSRDGDEPTPSRRTLLATLDTAAAGGLAGCEEAVRTDPPGPDPSVTLSDVRLVQASEDGSLAGGGGGVPDPPLAAGDPTTVGYFWSLKQAVGSLEALSAGDPDARPVSTCTKPTVGGDVWADGRITQFLVEGRYTPGYSGGSSPDVALVEPVAAQVQPQEIRPAFEVFGTVVDGRVRFDGSAVYDGCPEDA